MVFVRSVHREVTLTKLPSVFLYCAIWKEITIYSLHLFSGEVCPISLRIEYLHNVFGILLHEFCVDSSWRDSARCKVCVVTSCAISGTGYGLEKSLHGVSVSLHVRSLCMFCVGVSV